MADTSAGVWDSTRREFLKVAAATGVAAVGLGAEKAEGQAAGGEGGLPWYKRALRWGQINITEADAQNFDVAWWRAHWKRTALDGVILNAGGIFAYYPSKFPLQYRAAGERDLFGELTKLAHDDGLCVIARMDSSKAHEPLYRAHPDWFGVDAGGNVQQSGGFYLSCINSPYYTEFLPGVMREIIERTHPEGLADNIWSGIERTTICNCQYCVKAFTALTGKPLPTRKDWNDAVYRQWLEWNYTRRIEQWDFNNKVTKEAGGKDCLWLGMNGAGLGGGATFRDLKEICARSEMLLLDSQSRSSATGFQENAVHGKLSHELLGWDKVVIESMAMYQHGAPQFRVSAKTAPEVRQWMLAGFAGGIEPWWHHVGAYDEDRRVYKTAEPVMVWHKANQQYLVNRQPVASVAVAWSRKNTDYFGRDNAQDLVDLPWQGFTQALVRARIPFVPVHMDYLARDLGNFSVLVLPNVGAMSDEQIKAIRGFVERGGSIVASGQSSMFNEWGEARPDFALADIFGVKGGKAIELSGAGAAAAGPRFRGAGAAAQHTYLRLTPELRAAAYGPKRGDEPAVTGKRHAVLAGFDETDILPFGNTLQRGLIVDPKAQVAMTFIPAFPSTPPEISYMRQAKTDIPALVLNAVGASRVVYFAADIDRLFASYNFPDHGNLLANAVRWAANETIPLDVQGAGLVNCELYKQGNKMILHVVNLTSAGSWRSPVDELIKIGPLQVKVELVEGVNGAAAKLLVAGGAVASQVEGRWATIEIRSVMDHEVVVIGA